MKTSIECYLGSYVIKMCIYDYQKNRVKFDIYKYSRSFISEEESKKEEGKTELIETLISSSELGAKQLAQELRDCSDLLFILSRTSGV